MLVRGNKQQLIAIDGAVNVSVGIGQYQ